MIDIRYSIIIPHYNSPKLLQRCLDSIPIREDIEVIVVDDCSNPEIVTLAQMPGQDRPYTQVYQTPQGGSAGRARNMGLEHAKGEWLIFADADDYFEPEAFAIFDAHHNDEEDILFYGACSRISDSGELSDRDKHTTAMLQRYLTDHDDSGLRYHYFVPWSKMVRRAMVEKHHICFDETRWANDVMFSVLIGYYAKSVQCVADIVYCVTVNRGSLTMQITEQSLRTRYEVQLRRNLFLREHGLTQYELSIMAYLRQSLHYGIRCTQQFVQLGKQYHAHFLKGSSQWIKNAFTLLMRSFRTDNKQQYITH